jgi:hypothetical protein
MTDQNTKIFWQAQEFTAQKKPIWWYIAFVVFTCGLIAYAIYTRNILTLVTFIVIPIAGFIIAHQSPREVCHELSSSGVSFGQSSYPYRNIKKFWIVYTAENKTVNFETTTYLNNHISMQLGKQDPVVVRAFLKNYLPEDLDREESVAEIFARRAKF